MQRERTPAMRPAVASGRSGRPTGLDVIVDAVRGIPPRDADWLEVIAFANAHLVAPRLCAAVDGCGLDAFVEEDALVYLRLVADANAQRNRRLRAQAHAALAALNAYDVTPMLLKGAAELVRGTPHAMSRMMTDIDLLVAEPEVGPALAALRGLGYELIPGTECEHSPGSYARPGTVGAIDIHDRMPPQYADVLGVEEAMRRASLHTAEGVSVRLPDAETRLIIAIGHELLQDRGILRGSLELRELLDCHDAVSSGAAPPDIGWLQRKCEGTPMRLALEVQLLTLETLFGLRFAFGTKPSRSASLLRERRIFRARHPWIARMEWAILRRIDRMLGRRPSAPPATALPAARPEDRGDPSPADRPAEVLR